MSDLVEQIAKLEQRAHALKDGVSSIQFACTDRGCRENTLKLSRNSTSWFWCKKSCMATRVKQLLKATRRRPSFAIFSAWVSYRKVSYLILILNYEWVNRELQCRTWAAQEGRDTHRWGRQVQSSNLQQFCLHFQKNQKAEISSELLGKGPWNRVQLPALQRRECWWVPSSSESNWYSLEHLRHSQLDGQARAGFAARNESSDFDSRRVDYQNYWPREWRARGEKAWRQTYRAVHCVPQHSSWAGISQAISSQSEFVCKGSLIST